MIRPQSAPPPEPDGFDDYWDATIFGGQHDCVIVDPDRDCPVVANASAPLGLANLCSLIGCTNIMRFSVRELFGRPAHVYSIGFYPSDPAGKAIYERAPYNLAMAELLSRHGLEVEVRGKVVIVTADAIDPRDLQPEMVASDAETMPEVERDHLHKIAPLAEAEWVKIEAALQGELIPALLTTVPSMHRIAWLLRTMFVSMDRDIISHAAVQELGAKNPIFHQTMQALWAIQAHHFGGQFEELVDDGQYSMLNAPREAKPPGYSDRYGAVIQ